MKHLELYWNVQAQESFSALGRAVWDETMLRLVVMCLFAFLSVLSVEPYGMKLSTSRENAQQNSQLSVLSVEPYGMKRAFVRNLNDAGSNFQCSRSSRMG